MARIYRDADFRKVLFTFDGTFDGTASWEGWTDGTRWNGFLNVEVTPEIHEQVKAHFTAVAAADRARGGHTEDADWHENLNSRGRISYAYGYATTEAEPDHREPEEPRLVGTEAEREEFKRAWDDFVSAGYKLLNAWDATGPNGMPSFNADEAYGPFDDSMGHSLLTLSLDEWLYELQGKAEHF